MTDEEVILKIHEVIKGSKCIVTCRANHFCVFFDCKPGLVDLHPGDFYYNVIAYYVVGERISIFSDDPSYLKMIFQELNITVEKSNKEERIKELQKEIDKINKLFGDQNSKDK